MPRRRATATDEPVDLAVGDVLLELLEGRCGVGSSRTRRWASRVVGWRAGRERPSSRSSRPRPRCSGRRPGSACRGSLRTACPIRIDHPVLRDHPDPDRPGSRGSPILPARRSRLVRMRRRDHPWGSRRGTGTGRRGTLAGPRGSPRWGARAVRQATVGRNRRRYYFIGGNEKAARAVRHKR